MAEILSFRYMLIFLLTVVSVLLCVCLFSNRWIRYNKTITLDYDPSSPDKLYTHFEITAEVSFSLWEFEACCRKKPSGTSLCFTMPVNKLNASKSDFLEMEDSKALARIFGALQAAMIVSMGLIIASWPCLMTLLIKRKLGKRIQRLMTPACIILWTHSEICALLAVTGGGTLLSYIGTVLQLTKEDPDIKSKLSHIIPEADRSSLNISYNIFIPWTIIILGIVAVLNLLLIPIVVMFRRRQPEFKDYIKYIKLNVSSEESINEASNCNIEFHNEPFLNDLNLESSTEKP